MPKKNPRPGCWTILNASTKKKCGHEYENKIDLIEYEIVKMEAPPEIIIINKDDIKPEESNENNEEEDDDEESDIFDFDDSIEEDSSQLDKNEKQILREWTRMNNWETLFDSNKNNWSINSSTFNNKIFGKSKLIFLIEDDTGEKFGYYLNSKITSQCKILTPTDSASFVFNLKSNGRLKTPMKFTPNFISSYCLHEKSNEILIFLDDIVLYKNDVKHKSYCKQKNTLFNYQGIDKALCGKIHPQTFIPKRILVLQMKNTYYDNTELIRKIAKRAARKILEG